MISFTSCMIRTEKKARVITVTGTGSVAVENKEADLVLSVISRNEDVVKASEENAAKMTKVMDAVTESGVGRDSVYTSDFSIWQDNSESRGTKKNSVVYVVSNTLHVTVKNIENTGIIIDSAIKAGANSMNSLSYSAGDTSEAEKQARILAVRDAEKKANILVSTSGLTLGQVLNITEFQGAGSSVKNAVLYKANSLSTPISGGSSKVDVSVEVTYELQ